MSGRDVAEARELRRRAGELRERAEQFDHAGLALFAADARRLGAELRARADRLDPDGGWLVPARPWRWIAEARR